MLWQKPSAMFHHGTHFLPENAADFEPARVLRTVKPEARWLLKEWRAQKQ
jgi:hypothetical protein